jgi:stage V sporulation protein B
MTSKNLARSTFWLIISEIIFNLSGYVIHSFVGRILGPADYGRYGLVVTMTTMIIILVGNGIPTAMSKYISEIFDTDPRKVLAIKKKAAMLQTMIIGTLTILFFLSAPLIARALSDDSLTDLFRISSLIIPSFALASFYFSWYTGMHRFNVQSILKTLRSVFKVLAIVGLAWAYKVPGSIVGYALAAFSVFLVAFTYDRLSVTRSLKNAAKAQKMTSEDPFPTSKLINYAWQVVLFFLAYELLISIDLYMVKGIMQNDYLTGIYNAALTVGRIPYYIFYALTIMLLPVVSKSTAANDNAKTNRIVSQSLRLMVIFLVPSVILMAQFAQPIIRVFYSEKYADAAYPMSILAWGVGFLTIFYVMSFVLNGAGKTKISMYISIFGVIVNTTLNYFMIKKFGLVGSAIATSITSALVTFIMIYFLIKNFGPVMKISSLLKIATAGIIMYSASLFFSKGLSIFILWSIILFALYLAVLYLLNEIGPKDLGYVREIISSKKKKKALQEELSGNEPGA